MANSAAFFSKFAMLQFHTQSEGAHPKTSNDISLLQFVFAEVLGIFGDPKITGENEKFRIFSIF